MSQVLASSRFPVPNVLTPYLGDHGTLVIRTGNTWHVYNGTDWEPSNGEGFNTRELWKHFKVRPPSNVDDGWAGIFHGGPFARNYSMADLKAAFKEFMTKHAHKYQPADGTCFDSLKKARLLRRISNERRTAAELEQYTMSHNLIERAPMPVKVKVGVR